MKPNQIQAIANELRKEILAYPDFTYYVNYCEKLCLVNFIDMSDAPIKDFLCYFNSDQLNGQKDNMTLLRADAGVPIIHQFQSLVSISLYPEVLTRILGAIGTSPFMNEYFILFRETCLPLKFPNHLMGYWHAVPLMPDNKLPLHKAIIRRI